MSIQRFGGATTWARGALLVFALSSAPAWAAVQCYVKADATGANDGNSWAGAYTSLQSALTRSSNACTEIWVAEGVYKPVVPADLNQVTPAERDAAFHVLPGMQVYGGFAGGESQRSQAQPGVHLTVLSGDIDANDTRTGDVTLTAADIQGSNSVHVVVMGGTDFAEGNATIGASTVLDGLTITGGLADGDEDFGHGGGLFCNGAGTGHSCSPTLSRLSFRGNWAGSGGAICNFGSNSGVSSPTISQSTFSGNTAMSSGGAIYNLGGSGVSSPSISQSTFSGNTAYFGGAISNWGNYGVSSPVIRFVTFSGNQARYNGGAIYTNGDSLAPGSRPTAAYSVFWSNTASYGGPQAWTGDSSAHTTLTDSLVEGGCAIGVGANNGGTSTCTGLLLPDDPVLGPLQDNGGPTHTMLPGAAGGAVNAVACPASPGTDQRGVARPQGTMCDLGAVERRADVTLQVTVAGSGTVKGGAGACASTTSHCNVAYGAEGTPASVVLTAHAATGSTFTGWGGACSGTGSCSVSMSDARSVTARFALTGSTSIQTTISGGGNGGGAGCVFSVAPTWAAPAGTRVPLPSGYSFPYGELNWSAQGCGVGGTAVITVTLPSALPAGTRLFKWVNGAWTGWPLTPVNGNPKAFTYQVTDGQPGDSNAAAGAITDPALLAVPLAAPEPVSVPTLGQWALMWLGLIAAGLGMRRLRGV